MLYPQFKSKKWTGHHQSKNGEEKKNHENSKICEISLILDMYNFCK